MYNDVAAKVWQSLESEGIQEEDVIDEHESPGPSGEDLRETLGAVKEASFVSSNMIIETDEDETINHMVETMAGSKYRMKSHGISMCSSASNFYPVNTE